MKCGVFSGERGSQVCYINKYVILGLYGTILLGLNVVSWDHMSSGRLLEVENNRKFKMSAQKVAAYEGWSLTRGGHPMRGSSYTEKILIFWKSGH